MRVVNTDNFGSDYPDERFVSEELPLADATRLCDELNNKLSMFAPRFHKVVPNDYQLRPGFEP